MASQVAVHADGSFEAAVARHLRTLREAARRLTGSSTKRTTRAGRRDARLDVLGSLRAGLQLPRLAAPHPGEHVHQRLPQARRERELFRAAAEEARREVAHRTVALRQAERDGLGDEVGAALAALPHGVPRGGRARRPGRPQLPRGGRASSGCPIGTVMSRLHRARKQLQEMLADYALPRATCRCRRRPRSLISAEPRRGRRRLERLAQRTLALQRCSRSRLSVPLRRPSRLERGCPLPSLDAAGHGSHIRASRRMSAVADAAPSEPGVERAMAKTYSDLLQEVKGADQAGQRSTR